MAKENIFLDTNILLYAFLDFQDSRKHKIAVGIFSGTSGIISTQVVNELCSNVIKRTNSSEETVEKIIKDLFQKYTVTVPSESTLIEGSNLRKQYKFSFWDSLIVASALEAKAEILYSEDLQHKQIIGNSLTIINPFLD